MEPTPGEEPLDPPSVDKLDRNALSPEAASLLRIGRRKEGLVALYFQTHPRPETGERIAEMFRGRYRALSMITVSERPETPHVSPVAEPRGLDGGEGRVGGDREVSNEDWKAELGRCWFGLRDGTADDAGAEPGLPVSLLVFARRQEGGGFQSAVQHSSKQQLWDQQVSISYLLGLDWTVARQFHELREQEKHVKSLRRAAKSGALGSHLGRAADLRTALMVVTARTERLRERIGSYRVVPEYRELEREADQLTGQISELNTENLTDRALIRELEQSLDSETPPGSGELQELYAEAGIVLPELTRRRLDQVKRFHRAVVENRRAHLASEITRAKERIDTRERRMEERDLRRRQIMGLLETGGALERYTTLREELGRAEAEREVLGQRLAMAERVESWCTSSRRSMIGSATSRGRMPTACGSSPRRRRVTQCGGARC